MKLKSLFTGALILGAVWLVGCATIVWQPGQGGLIYTQSRTPQQKSSMFMKVYKSAAEVPYPYEQIGFVRLKPWSGTASPKKTWQVNQMKVEAAKRGADALILPSEPSPSGQAM